MTVARDISDRNAIKDRDAPPEDGASAYARGSFFGRRKGHKLRIHQADLIENLLPHLALDIGSAAPENLAELFEAPLADVRLEIGFGGGEHLIAEALAFPDTGFVNAYGLTETSSTVAVLTSDDHREAAASDDPAVRRRLGSVGQPLPSVE